MTDNEFVATLAFLSEASEAQQTVRVTCTALPNEPQVFVGHVRGFGDLHLGFNLLDKRRIGIPYALIEKAEVVSDDD